jgi:hypothetical protein
MVVLEWQSTMYHPDLCCEYYERIYPAGPSFVRGAPFRTNTLFDIGEAIPINATVNSSGFIKK